MGVYGWGRGSAFETVREYEVRPTYGWFPLIWYDLVLKEYVLGMGRHFTLQVVKRRVSKKQAEGFRKLLDE